MHHRQNIERFINHSKMFSNSKRKIKTSTKNIATSFQNSKLCVTSRMTNYSKCWLISMNNMLRRAMQFMPRTIPVAATATTNTTRQTIEAHENQNITLILIKIRHWCYVPTRFPFTLILINSYCFRFFLTLYKNRYEPCAALCPGIAA